MEIAEVAAKLETLSQEDYNMIVMLIDRLADKPSNFLKAARDNYLRKNSMSMEEIDMEVQEYRKEMRG